MIGGNFVVGEDTRLVEHQTFYSVGKNDATFAAVSWNNLLDPK